MAGHSAVNPEVERVRIPRGKDVFGKPLAHGSVWQLTPKEGSERIVWVEEARAGARSIAFREVVFEENPENAWVATMRVMSVAGFAEEFADDQVKYLGLMSPIAWSAFVSVIEAFDRNRYWTVDFVTRALPFLQGIDRIVERGMRPNKASLAMGCQPVTEPMRGSSRDLPSSSA